MIRIGIAGTGGMAAQRARIFDGMEGVAVTAVCSRSKERAAALCANTNARPVTDYAAMLKDVDAAALCLPNHLHATHALQALELGKHVLVEYPLCVQAEEIAPLRQAAADAGSVLMVGNTIIHEAMFRTLWAQRDRLGALVSASSRVAFYGEEIAGAWYMRPECSGSPFASYHYHHIEYYRRFLGEVEWVLANDESRPDPDRPGCLSLTGGTLAMGHEGGAMSCIQWYLGASGIGLPRGLWMNGDSGSVTVVTEGADRSRIIWGEGGEGRMEDYDDDWGVAGSCEDFVKAVNGELDWRDRLRSDCRTLNVGLAAAESARRKERIEIKDLPE